MGKLWKSDRDASKKSKNGIIIKRYHFSENPVRTYIASENCLPVDRAKQCELEGGLISAALLLIHVSFGGLAPLKEPKI